MKRKPLILTGALLLFAGFVFAVLLHRNPPYAAAAAARDFAAARLEMSPEKITVVSATKTEWPDECLGLPLDGERCSQAVTPGYEVTLQFEDEEHIYRTDEEGSTVRQAQ